MSASPTRKRAAETGDVKKVFKKPKEGKEEDIEEKKDESFQAQETQDSLHDVVMTEMLFLPVGLKESSKEIYQDAYLQALNRHNAHKLQIEQVFLKESKNYYELAISLIPVLKSFLTPRRCDHPVCDKMEPDDVLFRDTHKFFLCM